MTYSQKTILWVLGLFVIAAFGGLFYFVGQDLITYQVEPLIAAIHARSTPVQPTVLWVYPTETTTANSTAASSPDEVVAFVQNFKYAPDQERTLGGLIATLEAASEQLGNKISIEGWAAAAESPQHWSVEYTYREGNAGKTYRFAVDLAAKDVQGENPEGITLLSFLRQQSTAGSVEPTPTTVAIALGWGMRDYFTSWEYSVPDAPRQLKTVSGSGKQPAGENGFLAIPVRLRNIGGRDEMIGAEYYRRFALLDRNGQKAAPSNDAGLLRPTRLYCRSQGLADFTDRPVTVAKAATLDTALVFSLLTGLQGPYVLEISVYDGSIPHRYDITLGE
jgi:hypothetical protein